MYGSSGDILSDWTSNWRCKLVAMFRQILLTSRARILLDNAGTIGSISKELIVLITDKLSARRAFLFLELAEGELERVVPTEIEHSESEKGHSFFRFSYFLERIKI